MATYFHDIPVFALEHEWSSDNILNIQSKLILKAASANLKSKKIITLL